MKRYTVRIEFGEAIDYYELEVIAENEVEAIESVVPTDYHIVEEHEYIEEEK